MRPIGEVVDRDDARRASAERALPTRVEPVMVDDNRIDVRAQRFARRRRVALPGPTRSLSVDRDRLVTAPGHEARDVAGEIAADEDARRAAIAERVGEAQAPDDVPGPDVERRVCAKGDPHGRSVVS